MKATVLAASIHTVLSLQTPSQGLVSSTRRPRNTRSLRQPTRLLAVTEDLPKILSTPVSTRTEFASCAPEPVGLYIHIPYCQRRCRYCNFAIVPIGSAAAARAQSDEGERPINAQLSGFLELDHMYTQTILKELQWTLSKMPQDQKVSLTSIYFGGGTPSLAPVATIRTILHAILAEDTPFTLKGGAEITMEMDPCTFSKDQLQELKELGVNRISLGVQALDDGILESLGRIHRVQDIYKSLSMMQEVYGDELSYSLDLISGLPGLSLAAWTETLQKVVTLEPKPCHLSLYDLQVESGTVFAKWYGNGDEESGWDRVRGNLPTPAVALPSDAESAFMYQYAAGYLRSRGYEHYEVSSYALWDETQTGPSPWRSRHNQIYWATNSQWYALGLGATSFVANELVARPRTLVDYADWVNRVRTLPDAGVSEIDDTELLLNVVLKRLRTSEGLDLGFVHQRFSPKGDAFVDAIQRGAALALELGLAQLNDNVLRLVDPKGFLYSNTIIASIYAELEETANS
jgi:coproporphyrinogen III oxidase-like Fe-S oxidoreductase